MATAPTSQQYEADISFVCPVCAKQARTNVEVPEPNWDDIESTSDGHAAVICPECGREFSARVSNFGSGCGVTLHDHPDTLVTAGTPFFSPPEEGWWEDADTPPDPSYVFSESYDTALRVLRDNGSDDGDHLINRMVFAHFVTALEAFLGDTLLNAVASDKEATKTPIAKDRALGAMKFSLGDIEINPDLVADTVARHLRSVRYHNLRIVDFLYHTALSIRILNGPQTSARLLQAMAYRHDCVHRNGFDKDDNRLVVFTRDYVEGIGSLMNTLVKRVGNELADRIDQKFPDQNLSLIPF